jgi:hypothetical protein
MISSIPTKNSTTASIQTTEMYVNPGNVRANIDATIVKAPMPICTALINPGDFGNEYLLYLTDAIYQ